jgi:hypothetical protein
MDLFTEDEWRTIKRSIYENIPMIKIQDNILSLYLDKYIVSSGTYTEMTQTSKSDFMNDRQIIEHSIQPADVDANGIERDLQVRIAELWIRFQQIRENREMLSEDDVVSSFLSLCLLIYKRLLHRRIQYLQTLEDAVIVRDISYLSS